MVVKMSVVAVTQGLSVTSQVPAQVRMGISAQICLKFLEMFAFHTNVIQCKHPRSLMCTPPHVYANT